MNSADTSFIQVLQSLRDLDTPFPSKYLHSFSDLSQADLALLSATWVDISTNRKLSLLEDLEDLSESDTLTEFSAMALLAISDDDDLIREAGIRLLWENEDKKLIPILLELIQADQHERVRATAASAIGHFVYLAELDELPAIIKEDIEKTLLTAYELDPHKVVRRRALESLGYSSRDGIAEIIQKEANSGDNEWLESSLLAMGRSADEETWGSLVTHNLDNANDDIRLQAVKAAGDLGLSSVRVRLIDLLDDETNDEVIAAAIWSLSQIGGEGVRQSLQEMQKIAPDEEMQDFIEEALENLDFTEELSHFDLIEFDNSSPD